MELVVEGALFAAQHHQTVETIGRGRQRLGVPRTYPDLFGLGFGQRDLDLAEGGAAEIFDDQYAHGITG